MSQTALGCRKAPFLQLNELSAFFRLMRLSSQGNQPAKCAVYAYGRKSLICSFWQWIPNNLLRKLYRPISADETNLVSIATTLQSEKLQFVVSTWKAFSRGHEKM